MTEHEQDEETIKPRRRTTRTASEVGDRLECAGRSRRDRLESAGGTRSSGTKDRGDVSEDYMEEQRCL